MKVHVGYLLDRSGSMSGIWKSTIDGLNHFKNEQVEQSETDGEDAWLTLWAFDRHSDRVFEGCQCYNVTGLGRIQHVASCHHHHLHLTPQSNANITKVVDAFNVKHVDDLNYETVTPRGGTPLLDAIGDLISYMEVWERANKSWFDGKILLVIQTDGHENASRKFTREQVRDLITRKTNDGWEFSFMGAGIDAVTEGSSLGIHHNFRYEANALDTNRAYDTFSGTVSVLRSTGSYKGWEAEKDSEQPSPT